MKSTLAFMVPIFKWSQTLTSSMQPPSTNPMSQPITTSSIFFKYYKLQIHLLSTTFGVDGDVLVLRVIT
jgi:hypothetical protein